MSHDFGEPQSRNEAILQNMLGADNELGEPQSRIEELLMEILEQGGGGGGGGEDKVFVATVNVTAEAELREALAADKVILIKDESVGAYMVAVDAKALTNSVVLVTTIISAAANNNLSYTSYAVSRSTWASRQGTCARVNEVPFVAWINTTTDEPIKQAISQDRVIVIADTVEAKHHTVIYAENLGAYGAYLITADITEDTDRWNRLRPTFHAYTVLGNVWTAADPLEAVVEDDFANIVNALPTVGVPKTRYLLKVPDISTEGYHLDEYIYDANKWICISRDNVVRVKTNVTTETELASAINAGKVILITDTTSASVAVAHSVVSANYVDLYTIEHDTTSADVAPTFRRHRVAGAVWTVTSVAMLPFMATIDVTTEAQLKAAIDAQREILVTTSGTAQPYHTAIYAENLGASGAYLITADITEDTDRWNRLRPTFHAYTVLGNVWTAADPLEAVVEDDLANIVNSLPATGVPKTRYLLKVPDISTEGYHLDEYLYIETENKWICISRDNVVRVKTNVTTETELASAINAGKVILITDTTSASVAVAHSVVSANYVDLYTIEHDTTSADVAPTFRRHRVAGAVWTVTSVAMLPFMATIDVTTEAQLKAAIDAQREILVTTSGTAQPYHTAIYAENLGASGAYLITADITEDTDRWNRLRPTFHAYTVLGNVWTAADPLEAVVEDDLANIVNSLPATGVPKTRYLLKVPDISTEGYHLDEYIYTENKWICISRDNVVRVKTNVTTETELASAINAGKVILITDTTSASVAVAHSVVSANYVDLYTIEHDTTSADIAPTFRRHRVAGAVWTVTSVAMPPLVAILNVTTAAALKSAIEAGRAILVKGSAAAQSYRVATKAEILTGNSIKLATCETGVRPTIGTPIASFTVYTVDGTTNAWSASTTEGEIFIATIGVTTFSELSTAIGSSKPIFVKETTTGALMPALRAEANATAAIVQVLITATDPNTNETTCKIDRYTVTGSTWALSEIGVALADNYYTKTEIDQEITNIWQAFTDRRRVLHVLIRKNNDSGEYPMGWVAIVTTNTQETHASFCTWLYTKNYRSLERSYGFVGGCCGTTAVRNAENTGTTYVGRVCSGAYSPDGTTLWFKFNYNGELSEIPSTRCVVISFPLS